VAIITLTANTNYSALTVANGDTIVLAGFALTFDVNPAETNITVQTPGTAGTIVIGAPNTYGFSGWSFTAGTVVLLSALASGKSVGGTWTAGAGSNTRAITTNNGTINGNVLGGSGVNAFGVQTNNGTINGNVVALNGQSGNGVLTNNGIINGNVTGGSISAAAGIQNNLGRIIGNVTGGSAFGCHGIGVNSGSVIGDVTGGSVTTANGIGTSYGIIDGAIINGTGAAIGTYPSVFFCRGNLLQTTIPNTVQRLYSFGSINPLATNNAVSTTILSEGGGSSRPVNPFTQQVIG
jgi:hypothetical protein